MSTRREILSGWRAGRILPIAAMITGFLLAAAIVCSDKAWADEVPPQPGSGLGAMPPAAAHLAEDRKGLVPEGLSVDGISLAGMTADEARRFFIDRGRSGAARGVSFEFPGESVSVDRGQIGLEWANPHDFDRYYEQLTGGVADWLALRNELKSAPEDIRISYGVNTETLAAALNEALAAHTHAKQNPSLSRVDGQFIVTEGVPGVSYDADSIFLDLVGKLVVWSEDQTVSMEMPQIITPTDFDSSVFSFSPQPLGSYTTSSLGSPERAGNIARSAQIMNGHIFMPGEQISALSMYGSVSLENGYQLAGGYESGKVVQVVGGGVCQTTTTLYNAVLRAELGIVFRRHHSMMVSYVPAAMDATVVPAEGGDFIFQNTTSHAIYVESYVWGDTITVNIWGCEERPANRSIGFSTQILAITWPETLFVQVTSDTVCSYGRDWVWNKIFPDANPHPFVHAVSYKHVFVDGVEVSVTPLNDDVYNMSSGLLYHASDCRVQVSLVDSTAEDAVYPYLGKSLFLYVTDVWGNSWPGM